MRQYQKHPLYPDSHQILILHCLSQTFNIYTVYTLWFLLLPLSSIPMLTLTVIFPCVSSCCLVFSFFAPFIRANCHTQEGCCLQCKMSTLSANYLKTTYRTLIDSVKTTMQFHQLPSSRTRIIVLSH